MRDRLFIYSGRALVVVSLIIGSLIEAKARSMIIYDTFGSAINLMEEILWRFSSYSHAEFWECMIVANCI